MTTDTPPDVTRKRTKKALAPEDNRHGTANGYINHGCRCQPCRDAYAAWMKEARARRAARPVPDHVHGTENGYCNYSCRCERCIENHRDKRRADRQVQRFIEKAQKHPEKEPEYVRIQKELTRAQEIAAQEI